jgi:hypothetical protein
MQSGIALFASLLDIRGVYITHCSLLSIKSKHERRLYDKQKALKSRFCPTYMNNGYVLGLDEVNYTGKLLIDECPESNS